MKKAYPQALIALIVLVLNPFSESMACEKWSEAKTIGKIKANKLDESSGMAISRKYPRIYHNNDNNADIYVTNMKGKIKQKIKLIGIKASDVEDISIGRCPLILSKSEDCVYVADIGDNFGRRKSIKVYIFKEEKKYNSKGVPAITLSFVYPKGKRFNAEAMAIHPDGVLYILTKSSHESDKEISHLFSYNGNNKKIKGNFELALIQSFNFKKLLKLDHKHLVTAMDISSDGKSNIVLSYKEAVFINKDLTNGKNIQGSDLSIIKLKKLVQMEAVGFLPGKNDFIYSTETGTYNLKKKSPLLQIKCIKDSLDTVDKKSDKKLESKTTTKE